MYKIILILILTINIYFANGENKLNYLFYDGINELKLSIIYLDSNEISFNISNKENMLYKGNGILLNADLEQEICENIKSSYSKLGFLIPMEQYIGTKNSFILKVSFEDKTIVKVYKTKNIITSIDSLLSNGLCFSKLY